jgi:hypothetical protein
MSLTHVDPHVSEIVMVWIQSGDLLMVWIQISLIIFACSSPRQRLRRRRGRGLGYNTTTCGVAHSLINTLGGAGGWGTVQVGEESEWRARGKAHPNLSSGSLIKNVL